MTKDELRQMLESYECEILQEYDDGLQVKVNKIGDGKTIETAFRPDLPLDIHWSVESDNENDFIVKVFIK